MSKHIQKESNWLPALFLSFVRLKPYYQIHNPVMFVTYVGSILTTFLGVYSLNHPQYGSHSFIFQISMWLWLTVLFSNFSEAIAERRGKAHAESLKKSREEVVAKKMNSLDNKNYKIIPATQLRQGDIVLVESGDAIPADGQAIVGVASVDESAVTGESAPVIRESGGDRDGVTGGTVLLSDWLIIKITSNPGESFLDRMISLVEGAKRQKTPNEIALSILLSGMTLMFLLVVLTLLPFSWLSIHQNARGELISLAVLIALLVCLIPTTIGGLLSAIGIAGMDRLIRNNVIATSGRAVEAAGDVSTLLLDKTGTITIGNRQAIAFYPCDNVSMEALAKACEISSLTDDTPEGKSIVELARSKYKVVPTKLDSANANFIPFSAETRISGVEINGEKILKGAVERIIFIIKENGGSINDSILRKVDDVARQGSTPLMVAHQNKLLGIVELKDIIKPGIKERLAELRQMGVKSIMITGDNKLTAATIANEAGVDDFYAESTPEDKLKLIRKLQENGQLVAMVGDGTNDAPALAQTDVAVAMNSGTQAAKEAANMVDLDSDPTKLIEIVKIGKQLLITRGALTTFSISNDIAKYFAIIPAAFSQTVPQLQIFNIMQLSSPESAILSAVIFNALIIVFLIPLALRGVKFRATHADELLRRNTLIYGLGGVLVPFAGIKVIDLIIHML
jgi:potassium-transporting ATPase ATP-binding subunit